MPIARDWTPLPTDAGAHALPRIEVLAAADRAGVLIVSGPKLGRLAGVSGRTAWSWLRGLPVSPGADAACRRALGLEAHAQEAA